MNRRINALTLSPQLRRVEFMPTQLKKDQARLPQRRMMGASMRPTRMTMPSQRFSSASSSPSRRSSMVISLPSVSNALTISGFSLVSFVIL